MILHFENAKEKRKAMAQAIEKKLGIKATYLGAPTFVYEIGKCRIEKNGELIISDDAEMSEADKIIMACVDATGNSPMEWDENELVIEVPFSPADPYKVEILKYILRTKGSLIKKSIGCDNLEITINKDKICFPWFNLGATKEETHAYSTFCCKLWDFAKSLTRCTSQKAEHENEKYAFRCFLLRLGFIGEEYKEDRKVLLKNFSGSSAFKSGKES